MDRPPDTQIEVFRHRDRNAASERALVLQARGMPHVLVHHEGSWRLFVPSDLAPAAADELSDYSVENRDWPPRDDPPAIRSRGILAAAAYAVLLLAFHPVGRRGLLGHDAWEAGRLEAAAVRTGEWWRAATALTLHVDGAHLFGNLAIGGLFSVFAAHMLGGGLAWFCILLSGMLGNLANAWLQAETFRSVGASTGVFGALGLLTSFEWTRRKILRLSPLRRLAPLLGAAVLLGYLGVGGGSGLEAGSGRVDVIAHVTGCLAGALLGLLLGHTHWSDRVGPRGQVLFGVASLSVLALAWALALGAAR